VVEFEQAVGGSAAGLDELVQLGQVAGFVHEAAGQALAAAEAASRDGQQVAGDVLERAAGDLRLESDPRGVGAEAHAVVAGPAAAEVPSGGQRIVVVEDARPERRQGADAAPGAGVRAARLPAAAAAIGAGVGLYDGFFGPGAGSILVFLFVGVAGLDFLNASAAAKVVNTVTNLAALSYFAVQGNVLYGVALPMAACNLAGSLVGARLAVRRGAGFVRVFFLVVVSALGARIAYDVWRATP